MASLVRAYQWGVKIETDEVWEAFERMIRGDATTAADALALLAVARQLFKEPLVRIPDAEESTEAFALHCILALIEKATHALEQATGINEDTFTGFTPALECPQ